MNANPRDEDEADGLDFLDDNAEISLPAEDEPRADDLDAFAGGGEVDLTPDPAATDIDPTEQATMAVADLPATSVPPEWPDSEPIDGLPPELVRHSRYRVLRLLGRGGMGAVYQAEHRLMDRLVALKVINPSFTANLGAVERFRREVRAAARLHHPNIVSAFDADHAGGVHFLVMEYVEGVSLGEYLRQKGRLPVHEACDYARQAALGLQHAHDKGMIHRDIKPDNLMRTPTGQIQILDFGLARFAVGRTLAEAEHDTAPSPTDTGGQITLAGSLMGTPDYIAPEQATDSSAADIRADVYSLGCTLYQLLADQVPFPGGAGVEKVMRHSTDTPAPLAGLRPELPDELVAVVARMMAKNPADRYQTPGEAARVLEPFVAADTPRLRQWWVWLVAVAAVLAAAALGRWLLP